MKPPTRRRDAHAHQAGDVPVSPWLSLGVVLWCFGALPVRFDLSEWLDAAFRADTPTIQSLSHTLALQVVLGALGIWCVATLVGMAQARFTWNVRRLGPGSHSAPSSAWVLPLALCVFVAVVWPLFEICVQPVEWSVHTYLAASDTGFRWIASACLVVGGVDRVARTVKRRARLAMKVSDIRREEEENASPALVRQRREELRREDTQR